MQKGQLPGQRSRGGRLRKAERFQQISVVLPPELKRRFFATVPAGRRSGLIASLIADWLDALEESAAACQALEAKVTPVTPQG